MLSGRETEYARLVELLDKVESGAVACVLDGVPGIGKTALWRASVDLARRRRYTVLATAPSESEATLAFSGLGDLVDGVPAAALDALPEPQARALRAALLVGDLPESSREVQILPRAILRLLRDLAAAGPVLVAIDDEQWLDPASARVLSYALCRLREERVATVLAHRSGEAGALAAELARRFGGEVDTLSLEPLPMPAIKVLLEARLGRVVPAPVVRRIHQVAGGSPLWSLAIALEIEARERTGNSSGGVPIPRSLADAIELRLGHVDRRAHDAMLAVAALSQPTLGLLQAAVAGFELSDLESAQSAEVIEIAGGKVRFTHPLLASTHYMTTPLSKRRALHRGLAAVVNDEQERARHLALGAEAPDRDLADSLEQAAIRAARRGATESAAQILEDAARLTPLDQVDAQNARIVAAAEHRFRSGELSRAREMLHEVMPHLTSGPLRARAGLQLAEVTMGESMVAVALLEGALADAGGDDRTSIEIEWELSNAVCLQGRVVDSKAHALSALRTAERLGDRGVLARALGEFLLASVACGDPLADGIVDRLSAIDEQGEWTTYYQPTTALAVARCLAGDFETARPELERAAKRAAARGEEWDRAAVELALTSAEWELGNREAVVRHRIAAEDAMGEYSEGQWFLVELDVMFAVRAGDLTAARTKIEAALAFTERAGEAFKGSRFITMLAWLELLSGKPEAAHRLLVEQRRWLRSIGYGPAGYARASVWFLDFEALIALGALEEAEEVVAELWARAEACRNDGLRAIASRCEGVLRAARGELAPAIDALDRALALHHRCPRPFEHGRTLLEKGSIERRAKRKTASKRTLEHALAVLEPLGAEPWAARARDELSRVGIRRAKAADGLTPAQARAADLVAAGLTNAEIARELHMSTRTVETHLRRVYQEHGVASRSQLIAVLAAATGSQVELTAGSTATID